MDDATQKLVDEARLTLPGDARMEAYYFGFERTGVAAVDAILSAVAVAGKGSHHTEGWSCESEYGDYSDRAGLPANPGGSAVSLIQAAASEAAGLVRSLADALEAAQRPPVEHPAHSGHEFGGAYARAAALAAGDPDWMNATGGQRP